MANKVETQFRVDLGDSLKKIAQYEAAIRNLAKPTAGGGQDLTLQKAQREIQRYQKQQLDFEKQLTRQVEKEAEAQYRAKIKALQRSNEEALKILKQSSATGGGDATGLLNGLPGGGIASAFVAGGAIGAGIAAFNQAVDLTKQLSSAMVDLTRDAVNTSAEFDRTVKGLAIFAGGANNAKLELQALDKVALNTPGLSLPDAEAGYNRLRALGFAAQTSTDLIRGLAIASQQVGGTSQDVNRVVTNLIQLSSGSPRASQDIKELIHSLPNLRGVLQNAFGTTSGEELGKIFQNNPTQALEKFAESLGKIQAAQPGLLGALTKLDNVVITLKRDFGEPILDPLTESVKNLTSFLASNKETWISWGKTVGEAIRGVNVLLSAPTSGIIPQLGGPSLTTGVLPQLSGGPNASGLAGVLPLLGRLNNRSRLTQGVSVVDKEPISRVSVPVNKELLEGIEDSNKAEIEASERKYKLLEAQQKIYVAKNKQEELSLAKSLGKIREESLLDQITITRRNLDTILKNTKISESQKREAVKESGEEFAKLYNELALTQINTAAEVARKEKEIYEERKKQAEEFRKKLLEVRDLISNSFSVTYQNPYAKIFSDAAREVEKVKELTKGLNSSIRDVAIGSVQRANQASLFGQRIDTSLEVNSLQQKAREILGSNRPISRTFSELATLSNGYFHPQTSTILAGDLDTRIAYARRELAKRLNPNLTDAQIDDQERLRNQVNAILGTKRNGVDSDIANSITQNRLAQLFQSADPLGIPNELKRFAADTLNREADVKAKQEAQAAKMTENLNKIITEAGVKVIIADGEQYVRIINEAPGNATVSSRATAQNSNNYYK